MKKKILIHLLLLSIVGLTVYFSYFYESPKAKQQAEQEAVEDAFWFGEEEPVKKGDPAFIRSIRLDVPLEDQLANHALENGCEITSLSMLLQYYGFEVDKNQLANKLDYEPFTIDKKTHGDPNQGFVGNIETGKQAMGVHVEPIAKVARAIVQEEYEVVAGKGRSFQEILNKLQEDTPIWILSTLEMTVPTKEDFLSWQTKAGEIQVTPLIHSVVLTGMDEQYIYYNDPLGGKSARVTLEVLEQVYNRLGKQSLYLK
ncbi:C39 family peptidase [Enterococcus sp. LJL98]